MQSIYHLQVSHLPLVHCASVEELCCIRMGLQVQHAGINQNSRFVNMLFILSASSDVDTFPCERILLSAVHLCFD